MRRLPDGTAVQDEDEYCYAWRALAAPLEEALGWKLCAWDPDYMFSGPEKQTINLGVSEVRTIGKLIERTEKLERVAVAARVFRKADTGGGFNDRVACGVDLDAALAALKETEE